jgi:hypothetical protein
VIINISWSALSPITGLWQPETNGNNRMRPVCRSANDDTFIIVSLLYKAGLAVYCCYLAYRVRYAPGLTRPTPSTPSTLSTPHGCC